MARLESKYPRAKRAPVKQSMDLAMAVTNPDKGVCSFYVARKRRFCKMRTKENSKYCGEHQNQDPSVGMDRVACPLDPKQYHFFHAPLPNAAIAQWRSAI